MNLINEQSVARTKTNSIKELSLSAQICRGGALASLESESESDSESTAALSKSNNVTSKAKTTTRIDNLASPSSSSSSSKSSTSFESAALKFSTFVRTMPAPETAAAAAVESINKQIEKKISNKISFADADAFAADQINLITTHKMSTTTTTTTLNGSTIKPQASMATTSQSAAASKALNKMTVLPATTSKDSSCSDVSDCIKNYNKNGEIIKIDNTNNTISTTTTTTTTKSPEKERKIGCEHYKRRAMFVTPCCNKFYKCRYCHDEKETHHFDRKTLTELICVECNTRQKVQEQCEKCFVRFGKYTCLICNLFDDEDKNQYHCHGCGICRIGGRENFFHCETCNMCLPIELKIEGHRCVENISRSNCPVCLGAIHTSRIPCHIPDCGHLLHKMCFDQLLASGHYVCPTCQTSLLDMTKMWEYLDTQALLMTMPKKYENQRVYIFCNDCHDTCKTKFHFVGLKCIHCGGYNTTQDVKRRMSWANVDSSTSA